MNQMLISEFKAKCIESLKKVHETGDPLIVTLRGKPLVSIQAYSEMEKKTVIGGLTIGANIPDGIESENFSAQWESVS